MPPAELAQENLQQEIVAARDDEVVGFDRRERNFGIVLGLGLTFITEGVRMMLTTPWLGGAGLLITLILLS
jgi:hypothetical protein